jgi:large subunit ribosomal protein L10
VFLDYKGLTVNEDTALRNEFRKNGIEYRVLKNTLMRKALNGLNHTEFDSSLNGTTSIAFSYKDEAAAAKVILENAKKLNDKIAAKCALVEGQYVSSAKIKELSELPSKEVLISKMLGSLNTPVASLAGVLSATLRSLVYAVKAIQDKKAQA